MNKIIVITDSGDYYFQKGLASKTAKHNLKAAFYFDSATKVKPNFTAAYLVLGQVNLLMHRHKQAIEAFEAAVALSPGTSEAQNILMELYYNSFQYSKAIASAKNCTGCERSLKIIGMSFYRNGEFSEAADRLLQYLDKNPPEDIVCYTIADCYNELGALANAKIWLEKAILLNGSKPMWMYELGMISYNMNDFSDAVHWMKMAADNGIVLDHVFKENLALAYISNGQLLEGESLMNIGKNGLYTVADFYYRRHNYDRALYFCQKILTQNDKDANATYLAGLCFIKKGDTSKGNYLCEKAIKLNPELGRLKH